LLCSLTHTQYQQYGRFFALHNKQVYGATKSYLFSFSRSLRRELKDDNVSVSVVCPGGMNTRWRLTMEHRMEAGWLCRHSVMHPAAVARIALDGMLKNKEVIVPAPGTKCSWCGIRSFPDG
jgi:short-subunit dehydrogenase